MQVRDNAAIFNEISSLKKQETMTKIQLRKEQEIHENTKSQLNDLSGLAQKLQVLNSEKEQKIEELEEFIRFLKVKNPEELDVLRGKALEIARVELKQMKNYLAERDRKI